MDAFLGAWYILTTPDTLLYALCGVVLGLVIGAIPGLGGIFGLALLIPVTYGLEAHHAIYLLLGLTASTTISDTVPAVLIGVPGSVGASPTAIDGHKLAIKGQTARVLGAAYLSSLLGGLVGAAFLALTVPFIAPFILKLKIPDFFALGLVGIGAVILVSKTSPLRGVISAGIGLCFSFVGLDAMTGEERWTFSSPYLWDGLPVAAVFFGVFCLPELAHLLGRQQISNAMPQWEMGHLRDGVSDALREWKLVGSSGALASFLGLVPGIGLSAISWITYSVAAHRKHNNDITFGEGNIRGVIAAESAANATEGGTLIPTVTLGVPGSASMTLLLAALTIQGIVPGPGMLQEHADLTFSMVFALVFANIVGTSICIIFTRRLSYLALVPAKLIVVSALVLIFFGTFQINSSLFDIVMLCFFGVIGFLMKEAKWSRPAFILGFVLGPVLEQNFILTTQLYGAIGFMRPTLFIVLFVAFIFVWKIYQKSRELNRATFQERYGPQDSLLLLSAIGVCVVVVWQTKTLSYQASLFPLTAMLVITLGLAGIAISLKKRTLLLSQRSCFYWRLPLTKEQIEIIFFLFSLVAGLIYVGPITSTFLTVFIALTISGNFSRILVFAVSMTLSIFSVFLFSKLAHTSWPNSSVERKIAFLSFLF